MLRRALAILIVAGCAAGALAAEFKTCAEAKKAAYKLYRSRKYKEAVETFEQAIKMSPKPDDAAYCKLHIGYCLYGQRKYDEAATAFRDVTEIPKANTNYKSSAWCYVGYVRNIKKQYDEAIAAFDKAVEVTANVSYKANAMLSKVDVLLRRKQIEDALKTCKAVLELPKLPASYRSRALVSLGGVYGRMKKSEEACEAYAKAAAVPKAHPYYVGQGFYYLATTRAAMKQYDKAREAFEKALAVPKLPASVKRNVENAMKRLPAK